ncbi:glycerol-3-phosphate dehydrogenase/oxidase [Marinicrinis lubricantis]|uniref:Glycerol-3-phosphate dehydrogenase n=1 Tax=Marinicrinis lubricantis TaxID=2086470 RepID=A0ABW1IIU2_9BACL
MTFSGRRRTETLTWMQENKHDVLIIGGGITGAGIALDAASRGFKTALVDMQDFAAGTSSRSTKLIHGGLRYLKNLEFGVVAEVGKERAIVYENGPHVTTPERMLLPFYRGGTFGKFQASLGLRLYDFLAGVKRQERRVMLSAEQTLEKEPLLRKEGLLGGGSYVEYRTDDARLTLEVLKKAVECGARAVNYAEVEQLLYDPNGTLIGVQVRDRLSGKPYHIHARYIVNAAGPWVDQLREKDQSKQGKTLHLTKGVHLVIDGRRFPLRQAVYFDTPDGRMVFAIPREGKTYIGTTDTNYKGDLSDPRISDDDVMYLLRAANDMFPRLELTRADIESGWSGLRPLIHQEGKDPSEISRKDEIFESPSGLISIAGGKLTGYRKMAETIVDLICRRERGQGREVRESMTRTLPISGGDVGGSAGWMAYVKQAAMDGEQAGLDAESACRLARKYGSNARQVFQQLRDHKETAAKYGLPNSLFAEVMYAIAHEMAVKPVDFFIRRSGALLFDIETVRMNKMPVIRLMSRQLGYTEAEEKAYIEELERELIYIDQLRAN